MAPGVASRAMAATILIVEDEHAVARGIQYALQQEGYEVARRPLRRGGPRHRDEPGPRPGRPRRPAPGHRRLRGAAPRPRRRRQDALLVLTARDDEVDKVIGLELGADDYLTKPFGLRELMSRIKALLRRRTATWPTRAAAGSSATTTSSSTSSAGGSSAATRRISLTPTEFEILRHLASRPGRVYTRSELLELLRDYEALDQDEKTINVHVSHLRDKIEDDPAVPALRPDGARCRLRLRRALTPPAVAGSGSPRRISPDPAPDVPGPPDRSPSSASSRSPCRSSRCSSSTGSTTTSRASRSPTCGPRRDGQRVRASRRRTGPWPRIAASRSSRRRPPRPGGGPGLRASRAAPVIADRLGQADVQIRFGLSVERRGVPVRSLARRALLMPLEAQPAQGQTQEHISGSRFAGGLFHAPTRSRSRWNPYTFGPRPWPT